MFITDLPKALFPDAIALWQEAGLTRPWNDPEADLTRAMAGSSSTVLAGVNDTELLGTAMVGHDGHRGWVYYLAVRSAQQRRGLGRELMRACEQWVADHGVPKIQLMVRQANSDAISFYTSLGYQAGEVVVLGRSLTA